MNVPKNNEEVRQMANLALTHLYGEKEDTRIVLGLYNISQNGLDGVDDEELEDLFWNYFNELADEWDVVRALAKEEGFRMMQEI